MFSQFGILLLKNAFVHFLSPTKWQGLFYFCKPIQNENCFGNTRLKNYYLTFKRSKRKPGNEIPIAISYMLLINV